MNTHRILAAQQLPRVFTLVLLLAVPSWPGWALSATTIGPTWVVSPFQPGPDLPPDGRSLFDELFIDRSGQIQLPHPFSALLEHLNALGACPDLPDERCVQAVLIPLGRSLQRLAASPEFFQKPRIVAAMAGEPDPQRLLRDRLYLGFVEGTELIEVISYNATAARFEFQLVRDYRAGATPRVEYARRAICVACHQNQAPIFSRPLWQETNANPVLAARLGPQRDAFHGVRPERGVDVPRAINNATDRANLFVLWQRLWQDGCGANPEAGSPEQAGKHSAARACRAALFQASLRHRLNRGRGYPSRLREAIRPAFAAVQADRWPGGLALPNSDIPNRDPLRDRSAAEDLSTVGAALAHIPAHFEPLQMRSPSAVWHNVDDSHIDATVAGLAQFIPLADSQLLATRPGIAADLAGASEQLAGDTLAAAIHSLAQDTNAELFDDGPFRPDRLMPALHARLASMTPSIGPDYALAQTRQTAQVAAPAPVAVSPAYPPARTAGPLSYYCGSCHHTPDASPPNFLEGDEATVKRRLEQCGQRIRHRLDMWRMATDKRDKTPMPPPQALIALGIDPQGWPTSPEFAALTAFANRLGGRNPAASGSAYESLPDCH